MIKIKQTSFNKNFERIFFINLNQRTRKKKAVEANLFSLNLPYTRVSGVDCEDFKKYHVTAEIPFGSTLHKGTIGCFLAHKKCLEFIQNKYKKQNTNKKFIIAEDDIRINNALMPELNNLTFPEDCEIMLLNSACQHLRKPKPKKEYSIQPNLYKVYDTYPVFFGAFFYFFNYDVIDKILKKIDDTEQFEDYDKFLFKNFKCYTFITRNLSLINFKSDRDPEGAFNLGRLDG
jgi:GR25 family glycosyltransferase involved in LPS biosynthesis